MLSANTDYLLHGSDVFISIVRLNRYVIKHVSIDSLLNHHRFLLVFQITMNKHSLVFTLALLSIVSFSFLLYTSLTIQIKSVTPVEDHAREWELFKKLAGDCMYSETGCISRPEVPPKIVIKKARSDLKETNLKKERNGKTKKEKNKRKEKKDAKHKQVKKVKQDGNKSKVNSPSRHEVGDNTLNIKTNKSRSNMRTNESGSNKSGSVKYLIYQCDRFKYCGGWGDRQRSLVTVFQLAEVTNRTFGLNVTSPCDIRDLYTPNKFNWTIDPARLKGLSTETVDGMDNHFSPKNFHRRHTADVIYLKTNRDMFYSLRQDKEYSKLMPDWAKGVGRARAFKIGWNILMKRQDHLEKIVDEFLKQIPPEGDLICAHIRLGSTKTFRDSVVFNKISDVHVVWEFLDRYVSNASKIFIASDSEEVRQMARARYKDKELDSGGKVVNVDTDRSRQRSCDSLEHAILDQSVLSTCKVFVMSRSNFGQRAAMLGDLYSNLFLWDKGNITKYTLS